MTLLFSTLAVIYSSDSYDAWDALIAVVVLIILVRFAGGFARDWTALAMASAGFGVAFMILVMTVLTAISSTFVNDWIDEDAWR